MSLPSPADEIEIDGQPTPYQAGQTVLQAALAFGLDIPHLCYHPELEPIGSCRLCLVEAEGRVAAACTLPARPGLSIRSETQALLKLRQGLLTLLLEQGRHVCNWCERTGDCRLQEAAVALNVPAVAPRPGLELPGRDDSHPEVALDLSRCVLCGICVQASRKLDGKDLFAFAGTGSQARLIVNSPTGLLKDSAIAADDLAVRLCPVGALVRKPLPQAESFGSMFGDFGWNS